VNSKALITGIVVALSIAPANALTDNQAKAGGIVAGGMCMEYQGILDEASIKQLIRETMAEEGMDVVTMVSQPAVKKFATKMFKFIKDEPNCGMEE
jgi:hypothetical protein